MAKCFKVYLIGGSIPSKTKSGKFGNSCLCFDDKGKLQARFNKMHLCDISVKNQIAFSEGDMIEPGKTLAIFKTPYATVSPEEYLVWDCDLLRYSIPWTAYAACSQRGSWLHGVSSRPQQDIWSNVVWRPCCLQSHRYAELCGYLFTSYSPSRWAISWLWALSSSWPKG